MINLFFVDVCT